MTRRVLFCLSLLTIFSVLFLYLYLKSPSPFKISLLEANYPFLLPTPTTIPTTTIITTGDVMLGRSVHTKSLRENNLNYPFLNIQSLLSNADITLINLENPLIDPCPNTDVGMKFCAPTNVASALQFSGIDVANLANNHTQNYGQEGYLSTIEALTKVGIKTSDPQMLAVIEKNNIKFGFIGFDMVTYPYQNFADIIANSKKDTNVLIVSFHWGWEYANNPNQLQREIATKAVNSGADLVIGHHPHVVQPIEVIDNTPVVYSHGNLIFDQPWSEVTKKGIIGKFIFGGLKLKSYETIPIYMQNSAQPQIVSLN